MYYSVNKFEVKSELDKQGQRILEFGKCLEPLIVKWLREDGWTVYYNEGSQDAPLKFEIPVSGGLLIGHPDCFISRPGLANVLADIKTMNDKSFKKWKQEGTEKSKSQYVTQLHIYAMGLKAQGRTIEHLGIVGVNKNTSEMYIDLFDYDPFRATSIKEYAELVFGDTAEPEFDCPAEEWACEYCEYSEICKKTKGLEPVKNSELVSEVRK